MRRYKRCVCMCLVAVTFTAMLSGCGVKSRPASPEDSTYPLSYPAGSGTTAKTSDEPASPQSGTITGVAPVGGQAPYSPAPPATELQNQ